MESMLCGEKWRVWETRPGRRARTAEVDAVVPVQMWRRNSSTDGREDECKSGLMASCAVLLLRRDISFWDSLTVSEA